MPKLRLTPIAEDDLATIWAFIAAHNVRAADRLSASIPSAAERLAEFPGLGAMRDDLAAGLRTFPVGKYIIGYRILDATVEVLRIVHGMRKLDMLFGE